MTTHRRSKLHQCILILILLALAASQGCASATETPATVVSEGNQAIQVLNTETPPSSAGTATLNATATVINLYVPNVPEAAKTQLESQVVAFERQYQAQVEITYLDRLDLPDPNQQLQSAISKINTPTVVALTNSELVYLAEGKYLEPIQDPATLSPFLDEAVRSGRTREIAYGYPWQRYSCSPNFLQLAVMRDQSGTTSAAGRALASFLTSQENQNANLTNQNLRFFPTLRTFYEGQTVTCPAVTVHPLNPDLNRQMVLSARLQAQLFSERRQLQFQPAQVAGIDGSAFGSDASVLKAFALPTTTTSQTYKDRLVVGSITVVDPNVAPLGVQVNGKAASSMTGFKLPADNYAIACRAPDNCLAISLSGGEYPILPSTVKITQMPGRTQIPTVAFLKGSVTVCFYVSDVQYCITVF